MIKQTDEQLELGMYICSKLSEQETEYFHIITINNNLVKYSRAVLRGGKVIYKRLLHSGVTAFFSPSDYILTESEVPKIALKEFQKLIMIDILNK